jgi:phenylacetic acid degradation operon negative regulatory protein
VRDQLRRLSVGQPAARSVLLTVLGEYVTGAGGRVWQETLISALGELEYKPQAARQAIARSVTGGWLRSERHGRRAHMVLTEQATDMLHTGAERIYTFGEPWTWDRRWLLVVVRVPEERREVRHRVRTRLAWSGFGSLGGGLWITPHVERESDLSELPAGVAEVLSFEAALGASSDPQRIITAAWDLDAVREAYDMFVELFGRQRPQSPEAVFRAQTMLVHEWRKFPFLDPDLPEALLPAGWPGKRALELFRRRHEQWHGTAQEYFASLEALRTAA